MPPIMANGVVLWRAQLPFRLNGPGDPHDPNDREDEAEEERVAARHTKITQDEGRGEEPDATECDQGEESAHRK